jgi:DNA-directed RNA polymerase specialized sigma24 family protein
VIHWASLDWAGIALREDDGFDGAAAPDEIATAGSFEQRVVEVEALRAALARLRPDDAACLLLRVAQGFSAAEVAAMLGITTDAVAQRLSRARRRLRAIYLAQNPPDGSDNASGSGSWSRGRSDGDE